MYWNDVSPKRYDEPRNPLEELIDDMRLATTNKQHLVLYVQCTLRLACEEEDD